MCLPAPPSLSATSFRAIKPVYQQLQSAANWRQLFLLLTNISEPCGSTGVTGDLSGCWRSFEQGRCLTGINRADTASVKPVRIQSRARCIRHLSLNGPYRTHLEHHLPARSKLRQWDVGRSSNKMHMACMFAIDRAIFSL